MATVETDLIQQPATGPAKDVMMVIAVNADGSPISGGGGVAATWETLEGKPEFIGAGATAAEARTAIGAGTSNLTIGTTASTAMAGNTPIPPAPAAVRLVPVVGTDNQVLKVVAGVPAWAADTNTTYAAMTQAVATAGTSTTANTINALVLKTTIDNAIAAAIAPLETRIEALEAAAE